VSPAAVPARGGITWLGHSTVVVEVDGTRLVTDPVLRRRVMHLRRAAPVPAAAIGRLDGVLVSHVHLDHLDLRSLARLERSVPVVVPRGAGRIVRRRGFRQVVEVEAGSELELGAARVAVVPAEHGEVRRWLGAPTPAVGFVVHGSRSVYFAGDTDLFDGMADLGSIDVALLPVAGWGPRVPAGHLDPARAAEALRLLRPAVAVPVHWGTLRTPWAATPDEDAPHRFARLAAETAPDVEIWILGLGETRSF
jgi:L-ascorbate metabolism protein UlaG (beta-lactamase superfamily)